MGRAVLKTAGLTVEDAQFIPAATAGRLPGLIAGQIDGVALHPEDVYLAKKQKPALNVLMQLADLMPDYMFNAYGASLEWIARDRALLRDTAAAMIEANRTAYRDKEKVVELKNRTDTMGDKEEGLQTLVQILKLVLDIIEGIWRRLRRLRDDRLSALASMLWKGGPGTTAKPKPDDKDKKGEKRAADAAAQAEPPTAAAQKPPDQKREKDKKMER